MFIQEAGVFVLPENSHVLRTHNRASNCSDAVGMNHEHEREEQGSNGKSRHVSSTYQNRGDNCGVFLKPS